MSIFSIICFSAYLPLQPSIIISHVLTTVEPRQGSSSQGGHGPEGPCCTKIVRGGRNGRKNGKADRKLTAAVTDIVDNIRESEDRIAISQAPGNEAIVSQLDRVRGVLASLGSRRDEMKEVELEVETERETETQEELEEFMSWAIATCNQSNTRQFNCKTFPQRQQGRITIVVGDEDIHLEGIFEEDTASWTGKLGDLIVLPIPRAQIAVLLDCDQIFVMDEICVETVSWGPS